MTHPLLRRTPAASRPPAGDELPGPAFAAGDAAGWAGLSSFERTALIRDRLAAPLLGDVCAPRLLPVTRADRAEALRAVLPEAVLAHAVLHRTTAAWFLSCAPAPQRLQLMVHRRRRTTMRPVDPRAGGVPWEVRQLLHEPQDVDRLHGILVTTPVRTAADLACWDGEGSAAALRRILWAPHLDVEPDAVVSLLRERTRLPGRQRGVMAVRRAARELGLAVPG
ncbi:hypothetical protein [Kocuria palustris]|uniref:hypothetical protein n=1 Tax=Kocuria palustris TaxID=71999 RepID=UPI0011AA3CDD|nr:hypothetical protein [Kocuria palustris]